MGVPLMGLHKYAWQALVSCGVIDCMYEACHLYNPTSTACVSNIFSAVFLPTKQHLNGTRLIEVNNNIKERKEQAGDYISDLHYSKKLTKQS